MYKFFAFIHTHIVLKIKFIFIKKLNIFLAKTMILFLAPATLELQKFLKIKIKNDFY